MGENKDANLVVIDNYKKTLFELCYPNDLVATIWDFYVAKSVSKTCAQKRTAQIYGHKNFPYSEMLKVGEFLPGSVKIMPCSTIDDSLQSLGLKTHEKNGKPIAIDINTPKIVCTQPFTVAEKEPFIAKGSIGKAECVLTHIRNTFAHGCTYFFRNGFVMFEDKDKGRITARILMRVQTLDRWIQVIDRNNQFYTLKETDIMGFN